MAKPQRAKISSIIEELEAEIASLNEAIDRVNKEIRDNNSLPPAREEMEAALHDHIETRAARYRENLKRELRHFEKVYDGHVPIHDGINILRLRWSGGPSPLNEELLADAFCFLVNTAGKPVIDEMMASAPHGGITKADKEANDAKLRAEKRELETKLEETYCSLESAGLKPDRRTDLSPAVFLEWEDKDNWNREKLEGRRELLTQERAVNSKIVDKRNDILFKINKLQAQVDGMPLAAEGRGELLKEIAALTNDRKPLDERIMENQKSHSRSTKLFNACLDFLRAQGVKVDNHL